MTLPDLDLTGLSILVVDDIPKNVEVLWRTLEDNGYRVQVANSGSLAVQLAAKSTPALILLDVMMPDIDGFETCRRLKADENTRDIPVIFITALNDVESIVEGFRAGGIDYVTKPFKQDELLMRIRTHLERTEMAKVLLEQKQELEKLNVELEARVLARTEDLNFKVKELEGRDRITQHLLTVHTLEETLNLVLEILIDMCALDHAVVYLKKENDFQQAATIGFDTADEFKPGGTQKQVLREVDESKQSRFVEGTAEHPSFAIVPILRGEELLGLLEVDKGTESVSDQELKTIESFALLAAVAIYDAQVEANDSQWREQVDNLVNLGDMDFDEMLNDVDQWDTSEQG